MNKLIIRYELDITRMLFCLTSSLRAATSLAVSTTSALNSSTTGAISGTATGGTLPPPAAAEAEVGVGSVCIHIQCERTLRTCRLKKHHYPQEFPLRDFASSLWPLGL